MDDPMYDDRDELDAVALAFHVPVELDERLAAVWSHPMDLTARTRLRDYLGSPRLAQGDVAIKRLERLGDVAL